MQQIGLLDEIKRRGIESTGVLLSPLPKASASPPTLSLPSTLSTLATPSLSLALSLTLSLTLSYRLLHSELEARRLDGGQAGHVSRLGNRLADPYPYP